MLHVFMSNLLECTCIFYWAPNYWNSNSGKILFFFSSCTFYMYMYIYIYKLSIKVMWVADDRKYSDVKQYLYCNELTNQLKQTHSLFIIVVYETIDRILLWRMFCEVWKSGETRNSQIFSLPCVFQSLSETRNP